MLVVLIGYFCKMSLLSYEVEPRIFDFQTYKWVDQY